ncbi:hypothetical protein [Mycobacterium sp.]|uniref:hypothetical protein n=1 Tax=Mycobacterium sp. TaxID=1785 RepID=UPI003D0A69F4
MFTAIGLASAILLAVAGLIVGIIGLNRPPASTSTSQSSSASSPSTSATSDTTAADRKLCEEVGPLLHESNETGKAFVDLGNPGTAARDAGISDYEASVLDWVKRIQPVLDSHPGADPFLRRMLQRMIDDIRVYAVNIRPGPETAPDAAAWNDATIGYSGPHEVCHRLGVQW